MIWQRAEYYFTGHPIWLNRDQMKCDPRHVTVLQKKKDRRKFWNVDLQAAQMFVSNNIIRVGRSHGIWPLSVTILLKYIEI